MRLIEIKPYTVALELTILDCEHLVDLMEAASQAVSGAGIPEHLVSDEKSVLAEAFCCFFESAVMASALADGPKGRTTLSQLRKEVAAYRGAA